MPGLKIVSVLMAWMGGQHGEGEDEISSIVEDAGWGDSTEKENMR